MNPIVGIVIAVITLIGGVWLLYRVQQLSRMAGWKCPGCQRKSEEAGAGRFTCVDCDSQFVLNYDGKAVRRLSSVIIPEVFFVLVVAGMLVSRLLNKWNWIDPVLLTLGSVLVSLRIRWLCRRKPFFGSPRILESATPSEAK